MLVRSVLTSLSVGGLTLAKGSFQVKAATVESGNNNSDEFMAEPLTDALTRMRRSHTMRVRMEEMIMRAQRRICAALEAEEEDPRYRFRVDRWERAEGGGGVTCVIQDGHTFEKAGVNVSVVHGRLPPAAVAQMNARGKNIKAGGGKKGDDEDGSVPFFAAGISSVIHPRNPNVPTLHFNYRYFEVEEAGGKVR